MENDDTGSVEATSIKSVPFNRMVPRMPFPSLFHFLDNKTVPYAQVNLGVPTKENTNKLYYAT